MRIYTSAHMGAYFLSLETRIKSGGGDYESRTAANFLT